MKRLFLLFCFSICLFAQNGVIQPNLLQSRNTVTGTGLQTDIVNTGQQAIAWRLTFWYTGFTAVTGEIDCAPDNGAGLPGTYAACAGAFDGTSNPQAISATPQAGTVAVKTFSPHVAVNFTSATGSGTIHYLMVGYVGTNVSPNTVVATVTPSGTQDVNLAKVGGTATVTGGVAGSLGVGGLAANGAAVAGDPNLIAGSDGTDARTVATDTQGDLASICSNPATIANAYFPITTLGAQQVIAGSGSLKTYVCKRYFTTAAGENLTWTSASAGSCGGSTATLDAELSIVAAAFDDNGSFVVGAGLNLCVNPSATQAATLFLAYVQF